MSSLIEMIIWLLKKDHKQQVQQLRSECKINRASLQVKEDKPTEVTLKNVKEVT